MSPRRLPGHRATSEFDDLPADVRACVLELKRYATEVFTPLLHPDGPTTPWPSPRLQRAMARWSLAETWLFIAAVEQHVAAGFIDSVRESLLKCHEMGMTSETLLIFTDKLANLTTWQRCLQEARRRVEAAMASASGT